MPGCCLRAQPWLYIDWQLFRRLGLDNTSISNGDDLITQLVRNMTSRTGDPALLERVRRQAARRVLRLATDIRRNGLKTDMM
jgi:hypothetical protein